MNRVVWAIGGTEPAVYLVEPDGANLRTLKIEGDDFHWTLDGRIVFRGWRQTQPGTWIVDGDGGNARRLGTLNELRLAHCVVCPLTDDHGYPVGTAYWRLSSVGRL